jgi:hypothetical protein
LERQVEGDLFLQDIGQGFGFRPGSFDGAIRHVIKLRAHKISLTSFVSQYLSPSMASQR